MSEMHETTYIGGSPFRFEGVVRHATGNGSVVLCRDGSGALCFTTLEEWRAASLAANKSGDKSASKSANKSLGLAADGEARRRVLVTRESSLEEKVALIMSLFRGRTDVYGQGYVGANTKEGKLSYWPHCKLRWVRGVCPKLEDSKKPCSSCDHPSYVPLTSDLVVDHFRGHSGKTGKISAVGIYVVDADLCYLLAVDFDGPGWQEAAAAYRDACRSRGLSPAVERSRSGNGAHVWVFFAGATKASLARRVGEGLLSQARDACTAVSFRSYDRLFPLQDFVRQGDLGSLIALPLQGDAVRRGNSVFVDDQFKTLPDQCAFLSTIPKASPERIAELAEEFGKDPIGLPKATDMVFAAPKNEALVLEAGSDGVPASVGVRLLDGVRIDCSELPARLVNRLCRLAAFRNPEFTKKLRMHHSTYGTPRFIDRSRMDENELVLPRACVDEALSVLRAAGTDPIVSDERSVGRPIHARFVGELWESQKPCQEKLVAHELGVLVSPTGTGKSVIMASVIATHRVSTLVVVDSTALLEQWREKLTSFLAIDDEPPVLLTPTGRKSKNQPGVVGAIGAGKRLRSGIVDVALVKSLYEQGEVADDKVVVPFVREYGMVIFDEAHHVAAATFLGVLEAIHARYVYAMTATPGRTDGLDRLLFLECGPLRHEVTVEEQMAEQGIRRLLITRFTLSKPDLEKHTTWNALMDYISSDEGRNHLVASDAMRALRCGRTPLVLTRRVEHARTLARLIEDGTNGLEAYVSLLVGADASAVRKKSLEELRLVPSERPLCVVATGSYVGEGFDLDRLDTLLLAGPVALETPLVQSVGRIHRTRSGKRDVVVMDYIDAAIPMFEKEWRQRLRAYKKLRYQAAGEEELELVGLQGRQAPAGSLLYDKDFLKGVEDDLTDSTNRVVIASSWVRLSRLKQLRPLFEGMRDRGVSVDIVLREPAKGASEWKQSCALLQDLGFHVRIISDGTLYDCVVIDSALIWYGGIAPLAYPRKEDCALRFVSREVASSLVEGLLPDLS